MIQKILFFVILSYYISFGQVPKKIVVEHFTNTLCSICASRNPGFFSNLNNFPDVIHLAIHPSSPYQNCVFNQHNKTENDGRTNYYGVYGSTPRLVIQGNVISASADYTDANLFSGEEGQMTPASVKIEAEVVGEDSILVRIVIKAEAAHSLGTLSLFAAIAEDTIFYNAPNGEAIHYDVFRKSLFATSGIDVVLPDGIGDSVVFETTVAVSSEWNNQRLKTIAILQDANTKEVIQAAEKVHSDLVFNNTTFVDNVKILKEVNIYPNPISLDDMFFLEGKFDRLFQIEILDYSGRMIHTQWINSNKTNIKINDLPTGLYMIKSRDSKFFFSERLIKL